MDLACKYAFGKMLIIGYEPPFKVKGLWFFRGQEIPKFVVEECYDMKLYEWTNVDIPDEAQKERVSQRLNILNLLRESLFWMPCASSDNLLCARLLCLSLFLV